MLSRMGLKSLFSTLALPGVCMAFRKLRDGRPAHHADRESEGIGQERPVIVSISAKSPAARSELKRGDVICEINGKTLGGAADLLEEIHRCQPGGVMQIAVLRNGERIALKIRIGYGPDESIDLKSTAVV